MLNPMLTRNEVQMVELAERNGGWECEYCGLELVPIVDGQQDQWQERGARRPVRDHRLSRARGGSDLLENLALACIQCNGAKGVLTPAEFIARKLERLPA